MGVRKFELNRPTALATDWSRASVGCWLTQKFCSCESLVPGCCKSGWQTIHVASSFNSPAVSRYPPVEGEAFATAWALEKCKLFILGNPQLTLAVDHKPLLAILGKNQELADILNPRLMNFKLKSMAYSFVPVHIPGKKHVVPDTMSRRHDAPAYLADKPPTQPPPCSNVLPEYDSNFGPPSWVSPPTVATMEQCEIEAEELYSGYTISTLAAINSSIQQEDGYTTITWETMRQECAKCPTYVKLMQAVLKRSLPPDQPDLAPFKRVFAELTILNGVLMIQQRLVVPKSLQNRVLKFLHSAHAGVSTMMSRSLNSVYWPNLKSDLERIRATCSSCNLAAPSNSATDPIPEPDLPAYPFQIICSDFFDYKGKSYVICVDKYSNWLSVFKLGKNDAKHLIEALRQYFSTFGAAETICTDGASIYMSTEFQQFLKTWGISHRVSSAYHPTANKRAEVGVRSAKRLIRENVGHNGSLNTNKFHQALLAHRNAPDQSAGVSPAQIVLGHDLM